MVMMFRAFVENHAGKGEGRAAFPASLRDKRQRHVSGPAVGHFHAATVAWPENRRTRGSRRESPIRGILET
jgi:hypothetical protein